MSEWLLKTILGTLIALSAWVIFGIFASLHSGVAPGYTDPLKMIGAAVIGFVIGGGVTHILMMNKK